MNDDLRWSNGPNDADATNEAIVKQQKADTIFLVSNTYNLILIIRDKPLTRFN